MNTKKPRRFVRMFQPQFAPLVESGSKQQTVRKTPKRMPEPGDIVSLRIWTGKPYRSKQRILGEAVIGEVSPVEISLGSIIIDGRHLSPMEREVFAAADGFQGFSEMARWFTAVHGLPFTGILIRWGKIKPI